MKRHEANRDIRKLLNISGRELGERVEVTKQTISAYERGVCLHKPTQRVIEIELDLMVAELEDGIAKDMCRMLQKERNNS